MLFDSTLRKELARGFGATLVVILTIVITMMLIRVLGQAANGAVAPADVVLLMGYTALSHLPTILALSLFIAIVVTMGRMYRDSEMAIWFSSGIALTRFIAPVLRVSWPVLLVVAVLVLVVWPWGNRSSAELRERYEQRSDLSRVSPGVFQTSRDGKRVFFVEKGSDEAVNARGVFVLTNGDQDESLTSARSAHLETIGSDRFLVLDSGQQNKQERATGERTLASFARY
jgi:lipopolysaccharide export system permease protein